MTEPAVLCPICGADNSGRDPFEKYFQKIERKQYSLYRCPGCSVDFSWPMHNSDFEVYKKIHPERECGFELKRDWRHEILFRQKFTKKSLLDVGCGYGVLLYFAKEHGFSVSGLDYSAEKIAVAKQLGITDARVANVRDLLEKDPGKKWDIVTLFDVLEHVAEPKELITTISCLLGKDGYVAIT